MSVTVFIQDRSGDYSGEGIFSSHEHAKLYIRDIQKVGGYWSKDDVFIPWHRIDYIKIKEEE